MASELNKLRDEFLQEAEAAKVKGKWGTGQPKPTEKQIAYLENLRANLLAWAEVRNWRQVAGWLAYNPMPTTAAAAGWQINLFVSLGGFRFAGQTEAAIMRVLNASTNQKS